MIDFIREDGRMNGKKVVRSTAVGFLCLGPIGAAVGALMGSSGDQRTREEIRADRKCRKAQAKAKAVSARTVFMAFGFLCVLMVIIIAVTG